MSPSAHDAAAITSPGGSGDHHVRVGTAVLDSVMNLVGELVLARNQILQLSDGREEPELSAAAQRLDLVTSELQAEVMKTRLQPIDLVWSRLPRVVRDAAQESIRRVRLTTHGAETELDRTMMEAIREPLLALVRDAIVHGLEAPGARHAAGKPEEATVTLRAWQEAGHVHVEIHDDGDGRDTDRLAVIASSRTLLAPVGGTIDAKFEPAHGAAVRIKLPLTLAIIPALLVTAGGERYAVPQINLVELVRLDPEQIARDVERIFDATVYRLRGRLLPLARLGALLDHDAPASSPATAMNIVVVQADGRQFGLIVDQVNDTQEIVVKPLGTHCHHLSVYTGATILGDGGVALILDVLGLANKGNLFARLVEAQAVAAAPSVRGADGDRQRLLLFQLGAAHRMAIDLATVGRLEKIPRADVEHAGTRVVVQYRGQIMDLLPLAEIVGASPPEGDMMHVVVYADGDRPVGVIVGEITDIVEEAVRLEPVGDDRPGVTGRTVIQGRVTEIVDIPTIVRLHAPAPATDMPALVGLT